MTHPLREALLALARESYAQGERMLKSFSGADQADSEMYFCENRVYAFAGDDGSHKDETWDATLANLEAIIAYQDKRWRDYAAGQARKVGTAPKIKRGPSRGHSVISHRWVDPEAFQMRARHIRAMVRILKERHSK
jgi:hypothetical protein